MARKVIVSIISDQTVPNILFIKEKGYADFYYFISTEKMENKNVTSNIIKSLEIDDSKVHTIKVKEDSLKDLDDKLTREVEIYDEDYFLINITGGTKIMSLAVYNFFTRKGAGDIFYMPIQKNEIKQIFPLIRHRITPISQRLNLEEYLTAYGVQVKEKSYRNKNSLLKPESETDKLFKAFTTAKRDELFEVAENIRKVGLRGKKIRKNHEEENSYFEEAKIFNTVGVNWEKEDVISKYETKYITGEWFEEYVYPKIKRWLNKSDDEIATGLQLVKGGAPNEYDIMFTYNNAMYVFECKTDIADNSEGKISYLFTNTLYKAATLKKEFGLWVNYYLFALNDFSTLKESQKSRAEQLGIKLVGLEILTDKTKFENFIKK